MARADFSATVNKVLFKATKDGQETQVAFADVKMGAASRDVLLNLQATGTMVEVAVSIVPIAQTHIDQFIRPEPQEAPAPPEPPAEAPGWRYIIPGQEPVDVASLDDVLDGLERSVAEFSRPVAAAVLENLDPGDSFSDPEFTVLRLGEPGYEPGAGGEDEPDDADQEDEVA